MVRPSLGRHHDADPPLQNEMHGVGGLAGAHDGFAGRDLDALAAMHQRFRIVGRSDDPREPVAQIGFLLLVALMLGDDLVLALLQRMVEFVDDHDIVGDEFARPQRFFRRYRQMHQRQLDAEIVLRCA